MVMVIHTETKFCTAIKLDEGKIAQSQPRPRSWTKIFVIQILTRDLFAVGNLLVLTALLIMSAVRQMVIYYAIRDSE